MRVVGVGVHLASVTLTIRSDHTDARSKREAPLTSPRCKLIRGGEGWVGGGVITCDAQHAVLPARLTEGEAAEPQQH